MQSGHSVVSFREYVENVTGLKYYDAGIELPKEYEDELKKIGAL